MLGKQRQQLVVILAVALTIFTGILMTTDVASREEKVYPETTSLYVRGDLVPPKPQSALRIDSVRPQVVSDVQLYAKNRVSVDQWTCLYNLWMAESGWKSYAQNPVSTAYGIAQFLDSTWAGTGIAKTSDPYLQIDAGLIYIQNRHGTPCGAWTHFKNNNYY